MADNKALASEASMLVPWSENLAGCGTFLSCLCLAWALLCHWWGEYRGWPSASRLPQLTSPLWAAGRQPVGPLDVDTAFIY